MTEYDVRSQNGAPAMSHDEGVLLDQVEAYIREHALLRPGSRVLVGLSGGVDSVVLAHVLHRLGYAPVAAHVNYGLRGDASVADETFVRDWCAAQTPAIEVHVVHLDPKACAAAEGASVQEAARRLRYTFFAETARELGIDRVAVGHHRDDQAETLLLHLFRGSGVEGLAGMAPRRPMQAVPSVALVRPLLGIRRSAVEAYTRGAGLAWRTDASNERLTYDRNVIRRAILPEIEAHFEGATGRIAQAADLAQDYVAHTLQPELAARFAACAEADAEADGGRLFVDPLRNEPGVWRGRLILEALRRWLPEAPYQAALTREIEALLEAQVGRRVEVQGGTVWRERGHLRMLPDAAAPVPVASRPVPCEGAVDLPGGTLQIERTEDRPAALDTGTPCVVYADAEALAAPLTVRTWAAGDRIQPLGMQHTKKVSDLLTDVQVPAHRRAGVLVVCDTRRIVWVVGVRLAHPVRVRAETRHFVRLAYVPREASLEIP